MTLVILYSWKVDCAKVVKFGMEQLSLNAKRESNLWSAVGNNGTLGTESMMNLQIVNDISVHL